jgi:hypothetical protein
MKFTNQNGISLSCQRTRKTRNHFSNLPAIICFFLPVVHHETTPISHLQNLRELPTASTLKRLKTNKQKQQGEDRRSFPKPKNFFGRPFPSATKKGRVTKRENEKPCFFRIVSFLKHLFTGSHGYQTLGDPTRPSGKSDIIITRVFPGRHRFRLRGH